MGVLLAVGGAEAVNDATTVDVIVADMLADAVAVAGSVAVDVAMLVGVMSGVGVCVASAVGGGAGVAVIVFAALVCTTALSSGLPAVQSRDESIFSIKRGTCAGDGR